jgi:ABC-type xylose transport system permease subunit
LNFKKDTPASNRISFWKTCYYITIALLPVLIILNFYGLYSNQFYFRKIDNYIFPLVSVLHFVFLNVMQFKIRQQEYPDPVMRNVEYGMYAALMIYLFKLMDTLYILMSYDDYKAYLIPDTFLPMGVTIFLLQALLVVLTLISFLQRKTLIGRYDFEQIDKNMNSWQ